MSLSPEDRERQMAENREKVIKACREWISARTAWIDQKQKQFEDQYPLASPQTNEARLNDLEIWKFALEIKRWEFEQYLAHGDDQDWPILP